MGVGKETGFLGPDTDAQFTAFGGYSRTPNPRRMREGMERFLAPAKFQLGEVPPAGAIGWFEWRSDLPMHLAIVARFEGRPTMIHSLRSVGRCVENGLDESWAERVNSWWKYPGTDL